MIPGEMIPYVSLALGVIALLGHIKGWVNSGEKKLTDDVTALKVEAEAHETKLISLDRRIQSVESDIKYLPDRESQHRLELALEKVNGRLDTLNETLKPIKANGEALNDLLLERARQANV
ncbi:DUF2730 family protein [Agrobacterium pusense]|uniref:DUF2730 family protein n=1 Tax=Agrobacterium pusense TaxID=648995 RepID=UPI000ED46062|nr:Clp protease [Agrobacterium sp.]